MKNVIFKALSAVVVACVALSLLFTAGPAAETAYAATGTGSIKVDGVTKDYGSLGDLVAAVEKLEDKTCTIEMTSDWGNERLVIPKKAKVTLNMNGHAFNRWLTSHASDGEVIYINSDATLTVNGGPGDYAHTINVYGGDTSYEKVSKTSRTFQGGLIAGGFSDNGAGGIDIKGSNVTLNLNNVTIAGCRSAQTWGMDGHGGGIWVHGGKNAAGTVNMTNSTITGCYATNDGGGIYQNNHNKFKLTLINSHIDENWCGGKGGGIHVRGEDLEISGRNGSTVNGNHSGSDGGGIYIWNDDTNVSGLTVSGNVSAGNGGGIYTLEENIALSSLKVTDNKAGKNGGGIYIYNDYNRLSGLNVTCNKADGYGGGIFVEEHVDEGFNISGTNIIRDNSGTGSSKNLTLADETAHVNFNLSKNSDVHMNYKTLPPIGWDKVTQADVGKDVIKSTNCIRYLTADDPGWEFRFNPDQSYRKIYYVKPGEDVPDFTGRPYTLMPSTEVERKSLGMEDSGKKVTGLSGKEYPLEYGYFRCADAKAKVFYSDGFFDSDPFVYNEHLATATMAMAMTSYYLNEGATGKNGEYSYKHAAAREFLALVGCDDQNIYINEYNVERPGTDTIGITMGSKDISTANETFTLIPVIVRSGGYEREWANNVTLNSGAEKGGEAAGFADAADKAMIAIDTYLKKYDLEEKAKEGKVAFWVTGFSRGGATANLTSKRIREKYQNSKLFGYTYATPKGGSNNATSLPDEEYFCIHNIINTADLVPYVAMSYMGFIHYGVDHYMPGSEAGTITKNTYALEKGASGSANQLSEAYFYSDNEAYLTKTESYESLRDSKMEPQLAATDPDYEWDDYYHKARLSMNPITYVSGGKNPFEIEGIEETTEDLMEKLFKALQVNVVPTRDDYAVKERSHGNYSMDTYQNALRLLMTIIHGDNSGVKDKLTDVFGTFEFSDIKDLELDHLNAIGFWSNVPEAKKASLITILMEHLEKTGIYDGMSDGDKSNFKYAIPALLDVALYLLEYDIPEASISSDANLQLTGSLAYNMGRIFQNHQVTVYYAWLRGVDSYYEGETTAYTIKKPTSVPAIRAKGQDNPDVPINAGNTGDPAEFKMSETIILDVPEVGGEAIYYDIENLTLGTKYTDKIYRGGICLDDMDKDHPYMDYRITAHARYLEATSDTYTFDVRIIGDTHQVTIDYSDHAAQGMENVTNYFKEGITSHVMARLPNGLKFKGWKATDDQGRDVTYLLGDTADKAVGKFTMPIPGEDGFSKLYSLTFTPLYDERIDMVEVLVDKPVYENKLAKTATVILKTGTQEKKRLTLPVTWTYKQKKDSATVSVITDRALYHYTTYTAEVRIDQAEDIAFGTHISSSSPQADSVRHTINNTAGYAIVYANFEKERESEIHYKEPVEFNVEAWDVNTGSAAKNSVKEKIIETKYVEPGTKSVVLTAPDVPDEVFLNWEALDSGITISDVDAVNPTLVLDDLPEKGSKTIRANYTPVINKVTVSVMAPVAAHTPDTDSSKVKVTISDEYEVDNANIAYEWSPVPSYGSDGTEFDYNTSYTFTARLVPDEDGKIRVSKGSLSGYVTGRFVWSDDLDIEVFPFNERMEPLTDMETVAGANTAENEIFVTFPHTGDRKTDLKYISWPADITGVPYEQLEAGLEAILPTELEIGVKDQSADHIPVTWTVSHTGGAADGTDKSEWTAVGTVVLPEHIKNKYGYSLTGTVKITVDGNDHSETPSATLASGKYYKDEMVGFEPLSTEGEIRYTLDGSDPVNGMIYNGEYFEVNKKNADSDGLVTLRAVTLAPGMQSSSEAVYLYEFTNKVAPPVTAALEEDDKDIPGAEEIRTVYGGVIPELAYNGEPQIIAYGSDQYTLLIPEGETGCGFGTEPTLYIDENGNAVATNAGVYTLTARIKDGYVWVITDPETLEQTTTTEEQNFKVAIAGGSEEEETYNITIDPDIKGGRLTVAKTKAKAGETVTITAYPEGTRSPQNAVIKSAKSGEILAEAPVEYYDAGNVGIYAGTFTMPAEDVIVTIKFSEAGQPWKDENSGGDATPGDDDGQSSSGDVTPGDNGRKTSGGAAAPGNNGSNATAAGTAKGKVAAGTGDINLLPLWIALGAGAAAIAIAAVVVRRKS